MAKYCLWEYLQKNNIPPKLLLEKTGLSKSTINGIERNMINPRFGTLEKIAHALECNIEDFVISEYLDNAK